MATAVLSKTQQKKSLSAKKGPVKGLKNVLAQPYDKYWPLLKNDHGAVLEHLLKKLLPVLKIPEVQIPWPQRREMNKEQRIAARKAAQAERDINYNKASTLRKSITFGINAVTKLLEKDDSCCILLDSKVDPALLVNHIINMARDKSIPVLLIPFLKKITAETVGIPTAAISLKKHVQDSSENYFHTLFQKVSELSTDLSNSKTTVALFQNKMIINDEINDDCMDIQNEEKDTKKIENFCTISTNIYLYRTSKKERVFQPANSSNDKPNTENAWVDFIAVNNDDSTCNISKKNTPRRFFESCSRNNYRSHKKNKTAVKSSEGKVRYKPLRVKRLQGNESRTKATKPSKISKK